MIHHRLARSLAIAAATFAGLGLFLLSLQTVSASAPAPAAPAAAQTWHVDNTPGDGLVGYWKLDQVFDGATFNSALLSNTSRLSGVSSITATVSPSITAPNPGALQLDGVNGVVAISDAASLDVPPTGFSVAAWVRRATTGTYDAIYDSGTNTRKWWLFIAGAQGSNTNHFGIGLRGLTETYSTRPITDTNWHHLAVVVTSSPLANLTFYVDGAASGVATLPGIPAPTGSKRIGALLDGGLSSFFAGTIDEVRLYNRALSPIEVARLAAGRLCATDGLSWPTAFQDLQCALDTAVVHSGDQVWVAGGTYRPGTDRSSSFHLFNNVPVLGGFTGVESSPAQRPAFNPAAPLTVLSGDAAGDDPPASFANNDDNSCNVVMAGSLFIPGGVTSSLDGLAIQSGNARDTCNTFPSSPNGGGLADVSPNHLSLNNVIFRFNQTRGQGGALFHGSGLLTLTSVSFVSDTATNGGVGGGLGIAGGSVAITSASFVSNTASQGGALSIHPSGGFILSPITVTVASTSFTSNTAGDGGAVETQVGDRLLDLSFDQTTFSSNTATGGDGGALSSTGFATGTVHTRISRSTFSTNMAEEDGGAIQSFGEQLTITGSQFVANTAPASVGGALAAQSVVTINNSSFLSNTALTAGGLAVFGQLALSGSDVSFNRAIDTNNLSAARQMGGGALVSGTAAITNTTFSSNLALLTDIVSDNQARGGGLAVDGSLTLSGAVFAGNTAGQGGAVHVHGSASLSHSLIRNNTARDGGGLYVDGDLDLFSSRLFDNQAVGSSASLLPGQGGGVFLINGASINHISNNLFVGNLALCPLSCSGHGSALNLNTFQALISNNTIVFRSGLPFAPGSAATLTGTTLGLFNNIVTSYTVGLESLGGVTFEDYNLFSGETLTTTGVISSQGHSRVADPRFTAPQLDDFRLRLDSPAIDAGDNIRVPLAVTTDLDGGPRFVDVPTVPDTGAGSPPLVDLGAYEASPHQLFLPLAQR